MKPKRILIVFPYPHLAYSPTILNLARLLISAGHAVKVVYGFEEFFGEQHITVDGLQLVRDSYSRRTIRVAKHVNRFIWRPIASTVKRFSWLPEYTQLSVREILFSRIIKKALSAGSFDELVVVDILSLYWASSRSLSCHFLSLEVDDAAQLVHLIDTKRIRSVVIQSQERFQRLFKDQEMNLFIIQNAPIFVEPTKRTVASKKLIYNGTVWAPFGVLHLLEFARRFPEYEITLKGAVHAHTWQVVKSAYQEQTNSGKIRFSESYLDDDQLRKYLSDFSIGFCLYDFSHPLIAERRFNYETAPSGKVFLYLSVGMPIVATRISGFQFIEDGGAGILLDEHSPLSIRTAVDTVLSRYQHFSDNALALGKSFSFDRAARPFINFISQQHSERTI